MKGAVKLTALYQRLQAPLEQEQQAGYRDNVVLGGLEALIAKLAAGKPFTALRTLLTGYGQLPIAERQERISQALAWLQSQQASTASPASLTLPSADAESHNAATSSARASTQSNATRDKAWLDASLESKQCDLGAQAAKKLAAIGISSYRDLLYSFPKRYDDRRIVPSFAALHDEQVATAIAWVRGRKLTKSRRGMAVLRATLEDDHGSKLAAIWFNQPWLEKQIFPGQRLVVQGKVKRRGSRLELNVSDFEIDDDSESLSFNRIVGVYATSQGLSQAYIRRAVHRLLEVAPTFPDYLPQSLLQRYTLVSQDEALRAVHFPADEAALQRALRRLKFDEFLFLELRVLRNRDYSALGHALPCRADDFARFENSLPFRFTAAQRRALQEILEDMAQPKQMARLLQGDVGSGKTVVAAAAVYVAHCNGYQAALMAPTEILTRQHYLNLRNYLFPLGLRCDLLTGTLSAKVQREVRQRIASGEVDLIIGTHALIQEGVNFANLGLAVIDEEHRFGVEQRRKLLSSRPDVLVMSATPIPRSLALTYYGDLELSIIDELPPGRQQVRTRLVDDSKRRDVYRFAWGQIQQGRQVYLVTPLIEDSESETMENIVSTTQMYANLQTLMPAACRLAMLHGKMSGEEKEAVMARFRNQDIDMLVSTTVIEVGVDIPNASVMIIENAERFGLSQLHQLRGRVGRGEFASYCVLIAGDRSKKTQQRLEVIARYHDGFVIAEKDLALRGPGEVRGTRQSGMPDLILGDLAQDGDIIEQARDLAKKMLEADPQLEAQWAGRLRQELQRRVHALGFREVI